jgi:hypothetical protein
MGFVWQVILPLGFNLKKMEEFYFPFRTLATEKLTTATIELNGAGHSASTIEFQA